MNQKDITIIKHNMKFDRTPICHFYTKRIYEDIKKNSSNYSAEYLYILFIY